MTDEINSSIQVAQDEHVLTITLNRPDKLNAMTVAMDHRMNDIVFDANNDASIRAIVLTGAGTRAFSAGSDINDLDAYGSNWEYRNRFDARHDYARGVWLLRKPVVAAIHGYCIGGGLEMACASDIRIASPDASFGAGEIRWGWHGGSGQTQFLARQLGPGQAARLLLTGDRIDAPEALRIGLVQQVVAESDLLSTATALARRIAALSPIAIERTKHMIRLAQNLPMDAALLVENDSFAYLMMTEDAAEGRRAFAESDHPSSPDAEVELATGLHRIDTPLGPRTSSLYLIVGSRMSLLFDTGVAGTIAQYVLPYLAANGLTPEAIAWVVISHCDVDHSGGAGDVHDRLPHARVVAHAADADAIADYPVYEQVRARGFRQPYGWDEDEDVLTWARSVTHPGPVDLRLQAEAVIDLGDRSVDVLHVPGHTAGHLALFDPSSRSAIVSDAVLGRAVYNTDGTAAFPPTYRHVRDYVTTIQRLRDLAPQQLLTAHYPTFDAGDALRFLDDSSDFVGALEREVQRVLDRGPLTLAQLLAQIDPAVGDWPQDGTAGALAFPVAGHLEDLTARGLVTRIGEDTSGAAVFRSSDHVESRRA